MLLQTPVLFSTWVGVWVHDFAGLRVPDALMDHAPVLNAAIVSLPYLYPALAFVGLASGALAMLAGESLSRARHNRAVEREAQVLGMEFSTDARPFEGSDVHGLPLLQGDSSVQVANVVKTTLNGRQALVLDLPSCEPSEAEATHEHFTTVAAFRCSNSEIPEFEIGRKTAWSKVSDVLWHRPELIDDREFAKEFSVRGPEPVKVHDWLTPAKLGQLRPAVSSFHVCTNANWILIFRPGAQIPPAEFPEFLRQSSRIASTLLQ